MNLFLCCMWWLVVFSRVLSWVSMVVSLLVLFMFRWLSCWRVLVMNRCRVLWMWV